MNYFPFSFLFSDKGGLCGKCKKLSHLPFKFERVKIMRIFAAYL